MTGLRFIAACSAIEAFGAGVLSFLDPHKSAQHHTLRKSVALVDHRSMLYGFFGSKFVLGFGFQALAGPSAVCVRFNLTRLSVGVHWLSVQKATSLMISKSGHVRQLCNREEVTGTPDWTLDIQI